MGQRAQRAANCRPRRSWWMRLQPLTSQGSDRVQSVHRVHIAFFNIVYRLGGKGVVGDAGWLVRGLIDMEIIAGTSILRISSLAGDWRSQRWINRIRPGVGLMSLNESLCRKSAR